MDWKQKGNQKRKKGKGNKINKSEGGKKERLESHSIGIFRSFEIDIASLLSFEVDIATLFSFAFHIASP